MPPSRLLPRGNGDAGISPFLYFARRPGEAKVHLSDLKDRLAHAGPAVFAIVSGAVGVFLIIDGVTGIVGS